MRAVVQRVSRAQVSVNGEIAGKIGRGLVVLLGVATTDNEADAEYVADKIAGLRIFEDKDGKMNLSVVEAGGAVLAVSPPYTAILAGEGVRHSFPPRAQNKLANCMKISSYPFVRSV